MITRFLPNVSLIFIFSAILLASLSPVAAPVPTPVPSIYIAGRTFDPNEALVTPKGTGTTYYVDCTNGNNSYNGLSTGTAFKTIAKAVSSPLAPGDNILIRQGLYRERITPSTIKGSASNRITLGHYDGDGEVIIDASAAVTGWTSVSGQIYKAKPGFTVGAVVADNQPLFPEFGTTSMTEGSWYFDAAAGDLYLWAPGGGDPSTHDVGVVDAAKDQHGIFLWSCSYVTVYGLTVRFAPGHGIVTMQGNHNTFERCKTIFNGKGGISFQTDPDARAIKNYVYHNVIANWPRGKWAWGGWPAALGAGESPNLIYQGNISQKNGGEGILSYEGCNNAVYKDNISIDNWSVNFYIDQEKNIQVTGNVALCHNPDLKDAYHNGTPGPDWNYKVNRMIRAVGIQTADEIYGTNAASLDSVTIANNIIMGCRYGINHYGQANGSGYHHVRMLHNTIIVPSWSRLSDEAYVGIRIPYNSGNNIGCEIRNNIVYTSNADAFLLNGYLDEGATGNLFANLTIDHNLFYAPSTPKPVHWGTLANSSFDFTCAQWQALTGGAHGAGDVTGNPKFVNAAATDNVFDKRITALSVAIDAGVAVGVAADFDGTTARPQGTAVDIGAFEYAGSTAVKVKLSPNHLLAGPDTYRTLTLNGRRVRREAVSQSVVMIGGSRHVIINQTRR
jgi:hypothetical protein